MSGKSILLIIVLINVYVIEAEIIRGVDIPTIDVTRVLGKWYPVWGPVIDHTVKCLSLVIEQPSKDIVKLTGNITRSPETLKIVTPFGEAPPIKPINCTMEINSNILDCNHFVRTDTAVVVLDFDYDLYLAAFLSDTVKDVRFSQGGAVVLFGRQLTLPDRIIEKAKKSIFYQQSWNPKNYGVHKPDPSCL